MCPTTNFTYIFSLNWAPELLCCPNNLQNYFCNRKDLIRLSEGHNLEERGRRGSISGFLRSFSFWCWDISRIYSDSFLFHSHGCVKPHTKKLGVQFASKHFQYLHLLYSNWLKLIPTELFSFFTRHYQVSKVEICKEVHLL